jgi:hypothetical protein
MKERVIKEVSATGKIPRKKIESVVSAVHIAPINGVWAVKKAGRKRVAASFPSKEAAVDYGRNISRANGVDLIMHAEDGKVIFVQVKNEKAHHAK